MFMPTGTAMCTAKPIRAGKKGPAAAGNQETGRPRSSSRKDNARNSRPDNGRNSSRDSVNSRPSNLTAAIRRGSRATRERQHIIRPAAVTVAEA